VDEVSDAASEEDGEETVADVDEVSDAASEEDGEETVADVDEEDTPDDDLEEGKSG
jgi:hypothetical protein